jgi:predicted cupin superfamily sugar epimerase
MTDPLALVERLGLMPHPEGGFFRETYRSATEIPGGSLGGSFPEARPVSTGIYYMLVGDDFSAFHRIKSDELWHHYAGSEAIIHIIGLDGTYRALRVGSDLDKGEEPQAVVPAGAWFAAEVADTASYALMGCTVAPGFDYADFEMAERAELLRLCPGRRELIMRLTRVEAS